MTHKCESFRTKFRGIKSQVKKTETMAQFVIGSNMVDDSVRKEKERKEQENQEKARRHYKKDSRYLEDLYTLTYQEDSLEKEEDEDPEMPAWGAPRPPLRGAQPLASLQVGRQPPRHGLVRSASSGPLSLGGVVANKTGEGDARVNFTSSTLDTNLHKILARRMAGGQGVSLRSCKLLTRAYYSLLRDEGQCTPSPQPTLPRPQREDPKLDWATLIQTDRQQLRNIVEGYTALVRSLNDELMVELMRKDELGAEQDSMLETISELTDSLL